MMISASLCIVDQSIIICTILNILNTLIPIVSLTRGADFFQLLVTITPRHYKHYNQDDQLSIKFLVIFLILSPVTQIFNV